MADAPVSNQNGAAILLATSQSIVVFTAMLPPLSEVRKGDPNDHDLISDVRLGEAAAATAVVAIGIIASAVVGSPLPTVASAVCAGALVMLYESVLRN